MKKIISTVLCLFILLSCILPTMAATGVPEEVMESTKSVVRILSKYYNGAATGSGFVIKNEPGEVLIATNDHVVEGNPTSISIWVGEDRMVDAQIVFTTSEKDLCVLKVTDEVDMKPLKLSKEEPQHGAAIYVVGYPGAGDILSDTQAHTSDSVTITDGIISAIRSFTIEKGGNPVKLLQVNAAINSGNSGGPLFDTEGVVVGVNTYKVNADSQGVFGSVAISELWSLLNQYGIEIPDEPEVVEKVTKESSFLMPALICAGVVCLVLTVILIAKRRKKNTPQRKRKNSKILTVTLQAHMEKYPQGLGIGSAVSLLLSAAVQLRNLHNDGKLHLQICPENILIGADGASLKDPSSQETGRFNSGFAAPEIYRGAGFGITSDIYSFAAVLLYATTGKVPANSLQQDALEQDFSLLDDVIFAQITRKAMASNILDRTQSMQELIYSIAVYNAPVQERQSQPLRTVETVPVSISEERPAPAPVKEEQVKIPKHRKKTVPKKKHRKLLPIAAVLVCGIVAVVLLLKPAAKQDGSVELQSTEQTEIDDFSEKEIQYQKAKKWEADGQLGRAAIAFGKLGDYSDARQRSFALWNRIQRDTVSTGNYHTVGVKADGTVAAVGRNDEGQCNVEDWTDIVAVSAGYLHTVGLKADGTVVAVGQNAYGQRNAVEGWENIVGVSTGTQHTVGLKVDGTIVAVGRDDEGQCNVEDWTDIIAINAGDWHTVGLKSDGTVIAVGSNDEGQCNVEDWTDIVAISAGAEHTVGLKADGTVVAVGYDNSVEGRGFYRPGQCNVEDWRNIVAVSAGYLHTVGVKADGTVVAVGQVNLGQCNVEDWKDIVAINAGYWHTIGQKRDGTVVASGYNGNGQCNVSELENICVPAERLPARNGNETKPEETPIDQQAQYDAAEKLLADGETAKAAIAFGKLGDYKDARERSFALWNKVPYRHTVCIWRNDDNEPIIHALRSDGTVSIDAHVCNFCGDGLTDAEVAQHHTASYKNIVSLQASRYGVIGLSYDGTLILPSTEDPYYAQLSQWTDLVGISAVSSTVNNKEHTAYFGIRYDGTVLSAGTNNFNMRNVEQWADIVSVVSSGAHTLGLRADGTVVSAGLNYSGQCDVEDWTNMIAILTGDHQSYGLKADGTMVAAGQNSANIISKVSQWKNVAVLQQAPTNMYPMAFQEDGSFLGGWHMKSKITDAASLISGTAHNALFLKRDGTLWGGIIDKNSRAATWTDIQIPYMPDEPIGRQTDRGSAYADAEELLADGETARAAIAFGKLGDYADARERSIALWEGDTVSAGPYHVAAIQNDGMVVAVGHDLFGQEQCLVQDWKDIVSVAASGELTAGLRSDGTVLVTYTEDLDFREAVSRWEDIIQIGAAGRSLVGLKSDGSMVWVKQVTWENGTPICDLDDDLTQWKDIVSISVCDGNQIAGRNDWKNSPAIAGLRRDGTVILHGFDEKIVQKVSEWRNIVSIHAAGYGICGRKADGTVVGAYLNQNIADAVSKWTDIVDIDSSSVEGGIYVIGVRSDGTTAVWGDRGGLDGASNWTDIVSLDIGDITGMCYKRPIIGLKADGTVVVTGWRGEQPDLSAFTDIRLP